MGTQRRADRAAVRGHVRDQRDRLTALVDAVAADEPDSVHRMRVAARRLRSVIGTYPSVFPAPAADPLRDELRWLGTVLGRARDAEVLADRFGEVLDALPPELLRGPVRFRLVDEHRRRYRDAHTAAVTAVTGPRYRALVDGLDVLCATTASGGRPRNELRHARRRVLRAGRSAGLRDGAAPGPPDALHTTRKRAKALRYAAEAIAAARPGTARLGEAAERLQTVLGAHQDAVVARAVLLAAADRARAAGEDTFSYGVLAAGEITRAERTAADARPVLAAIDDL
ncbi:CHAD domain-containing protein [Rhodococcus sp. NPDC058532]|uniref:CHAD domain-containing protein n=1 Tax=Rhodococcus sp. NPDC058532 TaxID=3346540 RepID=UPI00366873CE